MRKKKTFRIVCFYCQEEFNLATDNLNNCRRAFCNNCTDEHQKRIMTQLGGPGRWGLSQHYQQYSDHLENQKARFSNKKIEKTRKFLVKKGGKLFRQENGVELGKIIAENELYIFVQKDPSNSVVYYSKETIINEKS